MWGVWIVDVLSIGYQYTINNWYQLAINDIWLVGWLVVFNVPSTARSFRDGTPIYCPLRRTWSSINSPFRPGIEPRAVAWQSITLPLRYASSTSMIFSWKLQLDYDLLVLSLHSVWTATKSWYSLHQLFSWDVRGRSHLKLIWKLDNFTLVSNNSSVWPLRCNKYFFGSFEILHFIW